MVCAEFQNDLAVEMDVINEQNFTRFELPFGRIFNIQPVPRLSLLLTQCRARAPWPHHQECLVILFHCCQIILKFCTEHGNDTAMLCAEFQNDLATEMDVINEQNFTRFELPFGRIFNIQPVPRLSLLLTQCRARVPWPHHRGANPFPCCLQSR